jgi:hypothetical protein
MLWHEWNVFQIDMKPRRFLAAADGGGLPR